MVGLNLAMDVFVSSALWHTTGLTAANKALASVEQINKMRIYSFFHKMVVKKSTAMSLDPWSQSQGQTGIHWVTLKITPAATTESRETMRDGSLGLTKTSTCKLRVHLVFDDNLNVYDGLLVAHADIIKAASKLRSLDANALAANRTTPAFACSVASAVHVTVVSLSSVTSWLCLADGKPFTLKLRKPSSPEADSHGGALRGRLRR